MSKLSDRYKGIANVFNEKFGEDDENLLKFLKEVKDKTKEAYEKTKIHAEHGYYKTFVLKNNIRLKTYSDGNYSHNDKNDYTNRDAKCVMLKKYVDIVNKNKIYDIKLEYTSRVEDPPDTFEEDIYGKVNSHMGCNIFFDWSK